MSPFPKLEWNTSPLKGVAQLQLSLEPGCIHGILLGDRTFKAILVGYCGVCLQDMQTDSNGTESFACGGCNGEGIVSKLEFLKASVTIVTKFSVCQGILLRQTIFVFRFDLHKEGLTG